MGRFKPELEAIDVAGTDEAGRGALAGPVVAAVVVFRTGEVDERIDDSKTLSPELRRELAAWIRHNADVGLGYASHQEVDEQNVLQAAGLAFERAYQNLGAAPKTLLVDGPTLWAWMDGLDARAMVGGDGKSAVIAAASILAKVERDAFMVSMDERYPGYGFAQHKGYGVASHLEQLKAKGPCDLHRRSFAPVRSCLQGEASSL